MVLNKNKSQKKNTQKLILQTPCYHEDCECFSTLTSDRKPVTFKATDKGTDEAVMFIHNMFHDEDDPCPDRPMQFPIHNDKGKLEGSLVVYGKAVLLKYTK